MKIKEIIFLSFGLVICFFVVCIANAESVLALDEVLAKIEIYDSEEIEVYYPEALNEYKLENQMNNDIITGADDLKIIILRRSQAEKAMVGMDSGFPEKGYINKLSGDFDFGAAGGISDTPRVFLLTGLMTKLPEKYQAKSLEEADFLIIIEDEYRLQGTLTIKKWKQGSCEFDFKDITSADDLYRWIDLTMNQIDSIKLYPQYCLDRYLAVYNVNNKGCKIKDHITTYAPVVTKNIDLYRIWTNMCKLEDLIEHVRINREKDQSIIRNELALLKESGFISDGIMKIWQENIRVGNGVQVSSSMEDYYWLIAEKLSEMDKNPNHQRCYRIAINIRDRNILHNLLFLFDYTGLYDEKSSRLLDEKDYMWKTGFQITNNPLATRAMTAMTYLERLEQKILRGPYQEETVFSDIEHLVNLGIIGKVDGEIWKEMLSNNEWKDVKLVISNCYWKWAKELENSENMLSHKEEIEEAIQSRSKTKLMTICEKNRYSECGDMSTIQRNKVYLAQPDKELHVKKIERLIEILTTYPE